jgi:arylsulfatase B
VGQKAETRVSLLLVVLRVSAQHWQRLMARGRTQWHLGFYQRAYTPLARGFDEHLGYFEGAIDYVTHVGGGYSGSRAGVDWHRGNQTTCFEDSGTWTEDLLVAEALMFLHRMARNSSASSASASSSSSSSPHPFFLLLPLHLIHGPSEAPRRFLEMFPERNLTATAASYGMCGVCECRSQRSGGKIGPHTYTTNDVEWGACRTVLAMSAALDWAVGEIVDGLSDAGLYQNTVIVYTSDNVSDMAGCD